jgi:hypothetical protein
VDVGYDPGLWLEPWVVGDRICVVKPTLFRSGVRRPRVGEIRAVEGQRNVYPQPRVHLGRSAGLGSGDVGFTVLG